MLSIPNIRTSIENQSALIRDEHARKGKFLRDSQNRLYAYSGGFTVVYPYVSNKEKWAFRCWHASMGNVRTRFEIISKVMQSSKASYLSEFVYVNDGIVVDGQVYPITRMKWVDGITIKNYICANKRSKAKLTRLAENFLKMVQDMHHRKFAHGDLQHGNIIVNDSGDLFLIDYDSFYCPELKGAVDIIHGLPDYQHPSRKLNKLSTEKLDYFSELIIYLSILGISEKPSLVDKYRIADSEHLLFTAEDFKNLKQSVIYKDLLNLSNSIDKLLSILVNYLKANNLNDLKPFYEYLNKKTVVKKNNKTNMSVKSVKENSMDTELTSKVLQNLEGTHLCYKDIPITGSIKQIQKAFQKLGKFNPTTRSNAHLYGELFGLSKVFIQFEYSEKYKNVVSVHFFVHKTACDVDTDTCFDDFRSALGAKYGTPQTITAPRSNGKPSYLYSLKNGTITLKKSADKVELIYSDNTTIYDKILAEKAKIARNKYLESLNRDI
ncbi:MAG: hypothetical protein IKV26_02500 [Paludibacteraceae bacterium]|nr:hypothetical protein [Paludibacteraceae bacterium]